MPTLIGKLGIGMIIVAGGCSLAAFAGHGAQLDRVDWSPGGGIVGDLWKFRCPAGGSVFASVDIFGDIAVDNEFESALDPTFEIYDGQGNLLVQAHDNEDCNALSRCGARCPAAEVACGRGVNHSIVVRDEGRVPECTGGGSYQLSIEVLNRNGGSLSAAAVKLGGGVKRTLPPWIVRIGLVGEGPLIDDGLAPTLLLPQSGPASQNAGSSIPPGKAK